MKKVFIIVKSLLFVATLNAQMSITDTTLKEYVGKYIFPEGNIITDVTVIFDSDQLSMVSSAGTSAITRITADTFSIVEFSGTAIFRRDTAKRINGVYIEAAGYIMEGVFEEDKDKGSSSGFYWKAHQVIALLRK